LKILLTLTFKINTNFIPLSIPMKHQAKNKRNNWGLIISGVLHLLLLLAFFAKTVEPMQAEEQREGLLVAIGDFTDTSIGEDPLGNTDEIVSSNDGAAPQEQAAEVVKATETPISSDDGVPIKTPTPKKETKPVVKPTPKPVSKPNTNTNTTSTSANTSKEELDKKKQQYGSLFGKGQGTKDGSGNQGDPGGSPDSKILEGISKGRGTVGGGLNGRKVVQAPTIIENSQKYGKVSVKVCVDKNGKVVTANFTQKGSSTTDAQLVRIAERGAMKYVFAPGELDSQCGTITFDFKLN
jgi:outer membrane biosynthesis protein TonB